MSSANHFTAFTSSAVGVTDGAEVSYYASVYCDVVFVAENPKATGFPRFILWRGSIPGSQQQYLQPNTVQGIPGPFQAGDLVGTFELAPAGGDSSQLYFQELLKQ